MAFVNDDVAVIADAVFDDTLSHQALNHGDVQLAGGLLPPAADSSDLLLWQTEKRRQPLDPLVHQLSAMDEHQRIDAALGDQPRCNDRLPEGRRRGQHAGVVGQHLAGGGLLLGVRNWP